MATTERPGSVRPGSGGWSSVYALPARRWWWRGWYTPAAGSRPPPLDVVLAAVIAVVQVPGTIMYSRGEPSPWDFDVFAGVLLTAGPLALLFRRRWPEATLVATFVAAAGYAAGGWPRGPAGYPAFGFAVVSAIMMGRRAFAWRILVVAIVAFTFLPYLLPDKVEAARSGYASAELVLVWLPPLGIGSEFARVRQERRVERAQAEREAARRRASEERLLIARELHDVLAHNISLINVQSGVALHLLDDRPEQARPALEAINEASEVALDELRSVIDVLSRVVDQDEDAPDGEAGAWAPRTPTAGLGDLDDLVRRTRAAGLNVDVDVEGAARDVPAGVGLAAFRVVQEALTNVVRHAGDDARAAVRLTYAPAELVVQVEDDGRGADEAAAGSGGSPAADSAGMGMGRGIAGMRERVEALDGTLAAGPRPGRGFRVRARLPLPPREGTR